MTTEAKQLVESFQNLPQEERSEAIRQLRSSANEIDIAAWEKADQEAWDAEGIAEAERRWEQDKDNPDAWIELDEAIGEVRDSLKEKREQRLVANES